MKVSFVVPTYNDAARIGPLLESLKSQTSGDWEVLFVDGGSVDNTLPLIRAAGFIPFRESGKRCPANARNQGIELATGDIIANINVDTEFEPDYVAKIIAAFESHPDADGICFLHKHRVLDKLSALGKAMFLRDHAYPYDGKYTVMKSSWWKKLRYDPELGFGEDRALREQAAAISAKIVRILDHIEVSETSFSSIKDISKRYLWYGRTMSVYLNKHPDSFLALYFVLSILALPLVFFAPITAKILFSLVFLYGCYRAVIIASRGFLWRELLLVPFVEIFGFVFIGLGFYQNMFGLNKDIGR